MIGEVGRGQRHNVTKETEKFSDLLTLMLAQLFLMDMTRMMLVASSASGSLEYLLARTRQASAFSSPTRVRSLVTITDP